MKDNILIGEISSISDGPTKNLAKIKANPFLWQFKFTESLELLFASEAQLILSNKHFHSVEKAQHPNQNQKKKKQNEITAMPWVVRKFVGHEL